LFWFVVPLVVLLQIHNKRYNVRLVVQVVDSLCDKSTKIEVMEFGLIIVRRLVDILYAFMIPEHFWIVVYNLVHSAMLLATTSIYSLDLKWPPLHDMVCSVDLGFAAIAYTHLTMRRIMTVLIYR